MHYQVFETYIIDEEGKYIPKDPGNRDYQTYLDSLPKEPEQELTPLEKALVKRQQAGRK